VEIKIKGKNMSVPPVLKDYALEKIARIERHLGDLLMSVEVELTTEKNPSIAAGQTVEVTLHTKGPIIRAKETSIDMHASIDRVVDKLERQIERYKDKTYSSSSARRNHVKHEPMIEEEEAEQGIVRVKQIQFKPMTPEEATMQMDLLSHEFFVFTNSDTEEINVVYRRRDSNYGLIEPA